MQFLAETFRAHPTFASLVQALFVIYAVFIAIRVVFFIAEGSDFEMSPPMRKVLTIKKYLTLECAAYALIFIYSSMYVFRLINWFVLLVD